MIVNSISGKFQVDRAKMRRVSGIFSISTWNWQTKPLLHVLMFSN